MNSSWVMFVAVGVGGAAGAMLRHLVALLVLRWHPDAGSLGTLLVNVTGCFLIGLLIPLLEARALPQSLGPLLVPGFLGGLTTFSTFGHESIHWAAARQRADLALLYIGLSLFVSFAALLLGRTLAHRVLL